MLPMHKANISTRMDFGDDITVLVGPEEIKFNLHTKIITQTSKFFHKACFAHFQENAEKVIRLPKVDAKIFTTYLQWAYSGEIMLFDSNIGPGDDEEYDGDEDGLIRYHALVDFYNLADYLDDKLLRNKIIDEFFALDREVECFTLSTAIAQAYPQIVLWLEVPPAAAGLLPRDPVRGLALASCHLPSTASF